MRTKRPSVEAADEIVSKYFPVLNEGFVSLVDYMGDDHAVIQAARVSYGAGTKRVNQDRGLLRYLRRHRHTTPSEMVELKFHMKMPIFVARQIVRHRTASLNEYSGRYSLMPMQFYELGFEQYCKQSAANKQGRGEQLDQEQYDQYLRNSRAVHSTLRGLYEHNLQEDLAKEIARIDLPLSMYTEWYWKTDLHNLFHFLGLRADPHAQWEVRQYAEVMAGMAKRVAPLSFEAWIDYQYAGVHLSRMEHNVILAMLKERTAFDIAELHDRFGLSDREISELDAKIAGPKSIPDFELDPTEAKSAEHFAERARLATPKADANPQS